MAVNDIVMSAAGASGPATFVEDVFSCFLYTGNGSTQTITNGIDLSTKGGLVWTKPRTTATFNDHILVDSARGNFQIQTNTTAANNAIASFNFASTGYTVPNNSRVNESTISYASWTFREQPKFFDIVTYTGDGSDTREVPHNLGSTPGTIIIKSTGTSNNWVVWHRSAVSPSTGLPNSSNAAGAKVRNALLFLNTTSSVADLDNSIKAPSSTALYLGDRINTTEDVNVSGRTYVAYLFAHDAGGFGLSGTDNVISCGSFTTDGGGAATVNLGYEPQWIMIKASSGVSNWTTIDNMRGFTATTGSSNNSARLFPNNSNAEGVNDTASPNATGFTTTGLTGGLTFIYIAIRRPMKTPTTGTEVFSPVAVTKGTGPITVTANFPVDLTIEALRNLTDSSNSTVIDRLRSGDRRLTSSSTNSEATGTGSLFDSNTKYVDGWLNNNQPVIYWMFKRAPGFFDVVCYTGTGVTRTVNHNLGVIPELILVKSRTDASNWFVYNSTTGNTKYLILNADNISQTASTVWNNTTPTSTVFSLGTSIVVNKSASNFVAYLFATCAGVSKVGSYTGTGATQTINAGLASGARFVMIKRTDSTGDWFVWDTARGMVAGTDPRLALNLISAESNANWVYTASTGFQIVTTDASVNASGGSYIYLAIA
jgi:hypothetical protein